MKNVRKLYIWVSDKNIKPYRLSDGEVFPTTCAYNSLKTLRIELSKQEGWGKNGKVIEIEVE